jgi:transcriptional regulator with XRE-family HTH domain
MQARASPEAEPPENRPYSPGVPRKLSKSRPPQGARLATLRRDAGLTQAELAATVGEPQQNIALWEQSDKPPRSDVIPKLAKALGVAVEDLFAHKPAPARRAGPVGKVRRLFDDVARLPRRQQDKIVEFLTPIVEQFKKTAG